jgi:hypothetical protein
MLAFNRSALSKAKLRRGNHQSAYTWRMGI